MLEVDKLQLGDLVRRAACGRDDIPLGTIMKVVERNSMGLRLSDPKGKVPDITVSVYTAGYWEPVSYGSVGGDYAEKGEEQMREKPTKKAYDVRIFEKDAEGNTIGVLADERNVVAESHLAAERAVTVRAVKTDKISEGTIYSVVSKEAE